MGTTAIWSFPGGSAGKESACNAGDLDMIPGLGRSPEEGMATPSSILPGEFHGQRSLAGYSLWGRKELDTTEQLILAGYVNWMMLSQLARFGVLVIHSMKQLLD